MHAFGNEEQGGEATWPILVLANLRALEPRTLYMCRTGREGFSLATSARRSLRHMHLGEFGLVLSAGGLGI